MLFIKRTAGLFMSTVMQMCEHLDVHDLDLYDAWRFTHGYQQPDRAMRKRLREHADNESPYQPHSNSAPLKNI